MVIKFFLFLLRFPKTLIILTLLLTAYFTYSASQILFDDENTLIVNSTVEPFMSRGSGTYGFFKKIRNIFGSEEVMVVALQPKNLESFDFQFFLTVDRLTKELKQELPGVKNVMGLTNTPRVDGTCSGKSFFHLEDVGSTCVSIIDTYAGQLDCLKNRDKYPQAATSGQAGETDADPDLEEDLEGDEEELDMGDDMDLEEDPADSEETGFGMVDDDTFVCTSDIFKKTEQQIYDELNEKSAGIFEEIKKHTLIQRDLISPDFKTVAIVVEFALETVPSDPKIQQTLQNILGRYKGPDMRVAYSGQSRQEYLASKTLTEDIVRILPWSLALMLLTLFFSFKSIRGMLIPLTTILVGILWTFGIFALTGFTMNLVTMVLPPLLICVGSAYIIHFLNQYFQEAIGNPGEGKQEITRLAVEHITVPLTVTALTTLAGFAALTVSPIPAIKEMGIFACVGIAIIILLTLTAVPAFLSLIPVPKMKKGVEKKSTVDVLLTRASDLVGESSKKLILFWVVLGGVALMGLLQVTVDSESKNFPADSSIEMDLGLIQENLAGTSTLRLILSSQGSAEQLQTASTINGLLKLRNWLIQHEGPNELRGLHLRIDKVYSVLEYIDLYRNGLDDLKDKEVVSFFRESRKRNMPKYLSDDDRLMQLNIRMKMSGTTALLGLRDLLDRKVPEFLPGLKVEYTRRGVLSSESADNISRGQVQSIILALIIIFVILSLMFFSFKMGIVALYPNIIAIAVFFGTLGWASIPIGVTISIIASIALGIGVDDTIHFLSHHNENVKKLRNEKAASMKTLVQTGKPMVFTTISLGLGFIIFFIADMESQVLFGVLTAYTLVVCLVTDLNFLPSIMVHTKLITAWDYVGLKFEKTLMEDVELFRKMTMRETKLATLLAYTVDLKAGEALFREKDVGNELFVILEGKVDIYLDEQFHDERLPLVQLGIGKSFGEMGLFRHSKRAASVAAAEPTKLLVLNDKVLKRLQRRYPKVATKLFLNLTRNLGQTILRTDVSIADKRLQGVQPTVDRRSIKEVVDEIIADGVVSVEEQLDLDKLIYADHQVSPEEREQIDRLNSLIERGAVKKEEAAFSHIFQNFSEKHIRKLRNRFERKEIPANVRIFSQGDYGDYMLLVLKGKFNIEKDINGQKTVVATIFEGNMIGAIALVCSDFIRTSNISTVEASEVIFLSLKSLERMRQQDVKLAAQFYFNLVCMLADRLEEANKQLYG